MNWSEFLDERMDFSAPYYAIKPMGLYILDGDTVVNNLEGNMSEKIIKDLPQKFPQDLSADDRYIVCSFDSIKLVESQADTLKALMKDVIDLGDYILKKHWGHPMSERMNDLHIIDKLTDFCCKFGMLYPQYIGVLPTMIGMVKYDHMPRSLDAWRYTNDTPYVPKVGCSITEILRRVMDITVVSKCLRALEDSSDVPKEWFSRWDDNKTARENIMLTLADVLSEACDVSMQFDIKIGKNGAPVSRMVFENPFDAIFAAIGNAFVNTSATVQRTAICQYCGKMFSAKTKRAQYCSERCRQASFRAKKEAKEGINDETQRQ